MATKSIAVPWHDEPIFMYGVNPELYRFETGFHIYVADWLRFTRRLWWHHSANEAHKTRQGGILAKRMGQSKGFPDFVHCGRTLAMELKVGSNAESDEQYAWRMHLIGSGWKVITPYSFSEVKNFVELNDPL